MRRLGATDRIRAWGPFVALAALTVAGAWLRLAQIRTGLYGDELISYFEIAGSNPIQVISKVINRSIEVSPPLYFMLASGASRFGDPALAIRIPSVAAGIALIPGVWLLGSLAFNRRAGLVAAALTSFSVYAIYYSVEARPYALLMLFSAASTIQLLKYLDSRRLVWLVGYAVASAAALYTHYSVVFVLLIQFAWAAFQYRDSVPRLVVANATAAVAFIPWLTQMRFKQGARMTMKPFQLDSGIGVRWFSQMTGLPYQDDVPLGRLPGTAPLIILVACLVFAAGWAILGAVRSEPSASLNDRVILIVLLVIASPVGMGLVSLVTGLEFTVARYFAGSFPALAVGTGALLVLDGGRLGAALSTIAISSVAFGAVRSTASEFQRPDTRAVSEWIESAAPADSILIDWVLPTNGSWVLRPYLSSPERDQPRPPDPRRSRAPLPTDLIGMADRSRRGFILVTNAGFMPAAEREIEADSRYRFELVATRSWPGLGRNGLRASIFRPIGADRTGLPTGVSEGRQQGRNP